MADLPRPPADVVSDAVLLARFAREQDEAAFELLVWRHRRLVFDTARRVVGNRADAEDAAQAAFLVLARQADRVGPNLAGWLYTVTYRCAAKLRKASGPRERAGAATLVSDVESHRPADAGRSPEYLELLSALDDELSRLPDRYRTPLVLCYLHGLTYPEAAARLGCPVGTLSGRLTRGKERLRRRLVRRGVAAVALSAVLETLPASADPLRTATITKAAVAFAAGEPVPTAALANGVLRAMSLNRLLAGFALSVAAVVAVVGTVAVSGRTPDDSPKPPAAKPMKSDKERMQGEWVFEAATMPGGADAVTAVWDSRLIVAGDSIAVTKYKVPFTDQMVPELKTTFTLDPTKSSKEIDLAIPELATLVFGKDVAGGPLRGVYRFDDEDTLTVCFADRPRFPRPAVFDAKEKERFVFTVKRSRQPGAETPKTATLRVIDSDGRPVGGAQVQTGVFQSTDDLDEPKLPLHGGQLSVDGRASVPAGPNGHRLTVYHAERRLIAWADLNPAALLNTPEQAVALQPECRLTVPVWCPETAGKPASPGFVQGFLLNDGRTKDTFDGRHLGMSYSWTGTFKFVVPSGRYTFDLAYSPYWRPAPVSVEAKPGEVTLDPVRVRPSTLGKLLGRPAPELIGVTVWKDAPMTLAGLRGKPVLLVFWPNADLGPKEPDTSFLAIMYELYAKYRHTELEMVLLAAVDDPAAATVERITDRLKAAAEATKRKQADFTLPIRIAVLRQPDTPSRRHALWTTYGPYPHGLQFVLVSREGTVVGKVDPQLSSARGKELFERFVGPGRP